MLHYRGSAAEAEHLAATLRAQGATVALVAADLESAESVIQLARDTLAAFGQWDAVVNNASMFVYDDPDTFTQELMERHLRVNTTAPILLAQQLSRHLQNRSGARGCIVNLLDQKLWNPNPDYLSYTLSKAALESATTLLAQALAPQIRVCGVAPGVTLVSGPAMSDAAFEEAHRMTPLGRSSSPDDIGNAVGYLLRATAVTGTTLVVDGGQHLWGQARDVLFLTPSGPNSANTAAASSAA